MIYGWYVTTFLIVLKPKRIELQIGKFVGTVGQCEQLVKMLVCSKVAGDHGEIALKQHTPWPGGITQFQENEGHSK